jgi:predicted DCC family thiol-disulfide oxidoreductase YuxK
MMHNKNKDIILFDGMCNMCNTFVNFIIKLDKKEQFLFSPISGKKGQELAKKFNLNQKKIDSIILLSDNKIKIKSDAAIQIIASLSIFFKPFIILKIIPKKVLDFKYDFIAKNRYRFFGKRNTCSIPTKKNLARFIE